MTLQQRHWRQGETWLFYATVMLAIFACYGLSAAGALMQNSLLKVSAEFMGADRIISSTRMADHAWLQQAKQRNIRYSEQWHFNSMLFAGAGVDAPMQLVSIKAVDSFYPVKGQLDIASANGVLTNRPSAGQL